jgi:hypothetical protein
MSGSGNEFLYAHPPVPGFEDIPDAVQRFVLDKIESISQLEALLLLHRTSPRTWTAEQLSTELRIDPTWAAEQLPLLKDRGLLSSDPSRPDQYRFEPMNEAVGRSVAALAECYVQRRVALIAFLYSRPNDRLRALADAFKVRRED